MIETFPSSGWSSRRHQQLARAELELLMVELAASGAAVEPHPVLDTAPSHSPALRRFLGF